MKSPYSCPSTVKQTLQRKRQQTTPVNAKYSITAISETALPCPVQQYNAILPGNIYHTTTWCKTTSTSIHVPLWRYPTLKPHPAASLSGSFLMNYTINVLLPPLQPSCNLVICVVPLSLVKCSLHFFNGGLGQLNSHVKHLIGIFLHLGEPAKVEKPSY